RTARPAARSLGTNRSASAAAGAARPAAGHRSALSAERALHRLADRLEHLVQIAGMDDQLHDILVLALIGDGKGQANHSGFGIGVDIADLLDKIAWHAHFNTLTQTSGSLESSSLVMSR